jgi:hypothetical protein
MFLIPISVIASVLIGIYIDKSPPYFPIEISRTVTGPVASWAFPALLTFSAIISRFEVNWHAWFGILLLAWIPDTFSHLLHMVGVAILGISFLIVAKWEQIAVISLIWAMRLLMKAAAIYQFETERHGLKSMIAYGKKRMFDGNFRDARTLLVFQTTGVLQWIVLGAMFFILR